MIKHVEIVNKSGKVLRGYLDEPLDFNGDLVVMFHGFTGNKTEHAGHFRNLSRILSKNSIGSLRMDFSGNGESDGEFYEFTFDTMMEEADLIIDYAKALENVKRIILLGFSMGGAVAGMMVARRPNDIYKLVLWSAAGDMLEKIRTRYENNEKNENENVVIAPSFEMSKAMYESINKYDTFKGIENFKGQVLIIHGKNDLSVNYLFSARYAVSFYNSHLYFINGAGHGYDKPAERDELYKHTLDFIK